MVRLLRDFDTGDDALSSLTAVELTRELIRFNTVNPPGNEHACAVYVAGILDKAGLRVEFQPMGPGRSNLIAILEGKGTKPPICLSGHLDTVPLGTAPWRYDPFEGHVEGGKIHGRGASDMKSGVAAIVAAACRLARRGRPESGALLVFTAGEETGCVGAEGLARSGLLPQKAGALIVAEPTSNYPVLGHKGALWLEGTARGVTAHGSMPERGVNAIYKAARAILKLEGFDFGVKPHEILGSPTINVGTMSAGLNVNSVPDLATVGIDVRTVPGLEHEAVFHKMRETVGADMELRATIDATSVWTDPANPWVQDVFARISPLIGERPEPRAVPYFTDASILRATLGSPPTLILGPGEATLAHQTDEYCLVHKVEQAAEIFETILSMWCRP